MANSSHLSGAEYMASIFGTEKDMVNCPFFYKIGACRNGIKCKRLHNKPTFSQTVLLKNLYHNPKLLSVIDATKEDGSGGGDGSVSEAHEQQHFDEFFEEIFVECEDKYGEIEEMNVCDNIGEHMIGNVYIKFRKEENAEACEKGVNERFFNGEPVYAELSPVTDFREACCRQYEMGECSKGGFCNFMHLKPISRELRKRLYGRSRGGAYIGGGDLFQHRDGGFGGGGGGGGPPPRSGGGWGGRGGGGGGMGRGGGWGGGGGGRGGGWGGGPPGGGWGGGGGGGGGGWGGGGGGRRW